MRPIVKGIGTLASVALLAIGCADTSEGGRRPRREKPGDASETGGISPDKQAEVQLLLQQRDPSTLRCYQDVLDEKHDRAFKGTVIVLLELEPGRRARPPRSRRHAEQQRGQRLPDREAERVRVPAGRAVGDDAVRVPVRTGVLAVCGGGPQASGLGLQHSDPEARSLTSEALPGGAGPGLRNHAAQPHSAC